jgi:hypothetical protein
MSKMRIGRGLAVVGIWLSLALPGASCAEIHINGTCDVTSDCLTYENYSGADTICISGFCKCPIAGNEACCPNGGRDCEDNLYVCRAIEVCAAGVLSSSASSSSSGDPVPNEECTTDTECPGPPDSRCGVARCNAGKCELEIHAGEPIENQFPGDCKQIVCSINGELLVWEDSSDRPFDENPCTLDLCNGVTPKNEKLPDAFPCPGEDFGICVLGQCQDCSLLLSMDTCPVEGHLCVIDKCYPPMCVDNAMNGMETAEDCGGPDCAPCTPGYACNVPSDCDSKVCDLGICQKSTHFDGQHNDSEIGTDCGYLDGQPNMCADNEPCSDSSDCMSNVCYLGKCQPPSCFDTVKNGTETGEDCGGAACAPCQQ